VWRSTRTRRGGDLRHARSRRGQTIALTDPRVLPKAIKNGREGGPARGAGARRSRRFALPALALGGSAARRRDRTGGGRPALQQFRAKAALRDLSFDTISGAGPNGAVVHYRVSEEPTARWSRTASISSIRAGSIPMAPPTSPAPSGSVRAPPPRSGPLHPRAQGPYRAGARRVPGGHGGQPARQLARQFLWSAGWITPMAPGTASAASCRCTKGRSASPSGGRAGRHGPGAAARHDPVERAGLLQDRRLWHPHRESGAG
jgi:Xaa-Pro aminopeptidase